jgi:hypothetical protein
MTDRSIDEAKALTASMEDFANGGAVNRRRVTRLNITMVLVLALAAFGVWQAFNAASTAKEARAEELSTFQSCLNRNAQDVQQVGLWRYLIQQSHTHTSVDRGLQHYVDSIFAERQCVNGAPAQTIQYLYHTVTKSAVVGGRVTITDKKCVPAKVNVYSSISWVMVKPYHELLPELAKSELLSPGCAVHTHVDAMPPDVVQASKAAFNNGYRSTTWVVSGTETPLPSNMNVVVWTTPQFKIVP